MLRCRFLPGAAALVLVGLGLTVPARAAPFGLRLSYTGDTTSTMSITWNTMAQAPTEVKYGTTPGKLTSTVAGTAFKAAAGLGYVHEVTLTGLRPSTRYYYVAGGAGDGFSTENTFVTGPVEDERCGALRFVFIGDNRPDPTFGGGENWPEIFGQAAAHDPAFALNGGDMVIDGDQIGEWKNFLDWTSRMARNLPFMPSMGNHDTGPGSGDSANYNQIFALPRATGLHGSQTEDHYFFTYGNAIFVSLSTDSFSGGSIPFGEQAAWLDEVLTRNPRKWKFVYYHKPSYTHEVLFSISHEPNEEKQNAAFIPVIDKHHVDVVFTSHNHWYERFEPSACATKGKAGSADPCSVGGTNFAGGTVHYVSGGAGAFTIPGLLCGSQSGRAKCSGDHHYILVDIANEVMRIDTWAAYPQANKVIDSITIRKAADVCKTSPPDAGSTDGGGNTGSDAGGPGGSDAGSDAGGPRPADAGSDIASSGDAAGPIDAAIPAKAPDLSGSGSPIASGCSCHVAPRAEAAPAPWLAAGFALVALLARRRRVGRRDR